MISCIRLLLSNLIAYFFGRVVYCSFCNPHEKQSIISKYHSFILGLGFSSICFWIFTIVTNGQNSFYPIFEITTLLIFYLLLRKKSLNSFGTTTIHKVFPLNINSSNLLFVLSLITILALILVLSLLCCLRYPDGAWDAVAFWNLKAKFLTSGTKTWSIMFSDGMNYTHTTYPLFIPCTIARIYIYIGENNSIIPMIFSYLFCISCFVLPFLYLNKLKNKFFALFAVCLLCLSPNIFFEGSKQYSDIPLAVFFLISIYELIIWDFRLKDLNKFPWLCVIFSSLSFWIKNEGIPWFILYTLLLYYFNKNKYSFFATKVFFGSIPSILSRLFVKYFANLKVDLPVPISSNLSNFINLDYYYLIGFFVWHFIKRNIFIVLIPIYLILGFTDKKFNRYKILLVLITSMYFIYIILYFFINDRLPLYLNISFPRIATHFLPSLIFLGCLLFDFKRKK